MARTPDSISDLLEACRVSRRDLDSALEKLDAFSRNLRPLQFAPAPFVPTIVAEPPATDYYLTERDRESVLAIQHLLAMAQATDRPGTRIALHRTISTYLLRLRENRDKYEWLALVKHEFRLSKHRAYEMVAFWRNNPVGGSDASTEKAPKG